MPLQRRHALIAAGMIALLASGAWFALRSIPRASPFGQDVQAERLPGGQGTLGPARIDIPFDASPGGGKLNVGLDLNNDGKIEDYGTVGGARQSEWIVRNADAGSAPGRKSFPFEIADPDVVTRNNFKLIAVLTKDPLAAWTGAIPFGSSALRIFIPAITPPSL